ncbi:unnamed protein product [Rotaria sp. Silwood1]|nr:unnamed protein product [Rotaria sp. Silwood1]CAF1597164.1 unnamed protein product [Rotaria sp. Silwood1]CAF3730686.1 unnamed protein product [Rotaria sp. Silwood1]
MINFNLSYDPVDKAIQDNPHTFNDVAYSVEKDSNSVPVNNNTNTLQTSMPEQTLTEHRKSEFEFVNANNNVSNVDSQSSTGSLEDPKKLLNSDGSQRSQSTNSITTLDDRACGNVTRLFGDAIKDVKEQANSDLPNDVPMDWSSKNLQSGDAGGQGQVRTIYYKNNEAQIAAIKIYSVDAKPKKNSKGLEDYLKERRMRAHRELVALKALKGMKNVSQLTSYTQDNTNIPDKQEDAIAGNKIYWTIINYIDGCTLEQFMEKHESMGLLNAIRLTQKLLLTIKQIHGVGVVHRDIKPANLLVVHDMNTLIETAEIHVIDFGLAYIENREDDVDWSEFEEKEKFRQTHFGCTLGIAKELRPGLTKQLRSYIMTTFDKGFENAEYQWTVEQLEYRLESIRHILEESTIPFDQQLSNATRSLLALESATALLSQYSIKIFYKVSVAFESAKAKFIARPPSCSWYDGHCYWLQYRQDMTERQNYDILSYHQNKQQWMLIIICSVHFDENGDRITLLIGSDFNGIYIELPLGQYAPIELDSLNIEVEFERELINLLQVMCKTKPTTNTGSVNSAN